MEKPTYHILLCQSFRAKGEPKGVCHKKSSGLAGYVEEQILDRGLDALLTTTSCLKQCDNGPVMVIYPQNVWYGGVESEDAVDAIMDAMEEGGVAEDFAL